jgi:hypothetical protein
VLDEPHDQPSCNSRKNDSEQNPRYHDVRSDLVAGKADGVAGIVSSGVERVALRQANTKHQN